LKCVFAGEKLAKHKTLFPVYETCPVIRIRIKFFLFIFMKKILKHIVVIIITLEARLVLRKYKPKIIAVTGSVGKTSTKDAIAVVLQKHFFIRSSMKSFNSEIGVPLTILGCESGWSSVWKWMKIILEGVALLVLHNHYPSVLVLEVGTDRPGDIKKVTSWLHPDIAVVTRIGAVPVHVEFFASRQALITEKANLVSAVKKDGVVILNHDDSDVMSMAQHVLTDVHLVSFGLSEGSVIRGIKPEICYAKDGTPEGLSSQVVCDGSTTPFRLYGSINEAYLFSALAACATAHSMGLPLTTIVERLSELTPSPGRSRLLEGIKETTIIDDSYNASPTAVQSALQGLRAVQTTGHKIAALGDMMELGKESVREHAKVGELAVESADVLVTVGLRA
jgi:UDP-N-acetylmuramoyl-tripeptide--D-alanyl-D-alanine ligase